MDMSSHRPAAAAAAWLALLLICAAAALLSPAAAAEPGKAKCEIIALEGPCDAPAWERGLAETTVTAATLAEGAGQYHLPGVKRFKGSVLGYVTPWNRAGYEAAIRFRAKLTHISPVWYQLRANDGELALVGGHEVNATWIEALRQVPQANAPAAAAATAGGEGGAAGADEWAAEGGEGETAAAAAAAVPDEAACEADAATGTCSVEPTLKQPHAPPRIVPRVIVELQPRELGLLLGRPGPAIERLVAECERHGYDGLVLEAWMGWAAMGAMEDEGFRGAALGFMRQLAANLKASGGKELLLAVPPALPANAHRPFARPEHLAQLAGDVAGFSVMTYDYSGDPSTPGPNAPLPWQQKNMQLLVQGSGGSSDEGVLPAGSILLGMPLYGYDWSKHSSSGAVDLKAVTAGRFLGVLAKWQPALRWDAEAAEHHIQFKEGRLRHTLYFPTPASLRARLELAERAGAGISLWELGQGYDALFDLL